MRRGDSVARKTRHSRMDKKIRNYSEFGVPRIWVVDGATRIGWDCSDGNCLREERFELSNTLIYLSLAELFTELDEAERGAPQAHYRLKGPSLIFLGVILLHPHRCRQPLTHRGSEVVKRLDFQL